MQFPREPLSAASGHLGSTKPAVSFFSVKTCACTQTNWKNSLVPSSVSSLLLCSAPAVGVRPVPRSLCFPSIQSCDSFNSSSNLHHHTFLWTTPTIRPHRHRGTHTAALLLLDNSYYSPETVFSHSFSLHYCHSPDSGVSVYQV